MQLLGYARDGKLGIASAEPIFPATLARSSGDCSELVLYTTRDHDCISNRIGSGIRNCPRCRCRLATSGALPTPSTIDRAIIMLNDRRFWGHASGPSSPGKTLHRFIHYWHAHAARRSALPRERFSPLAQSGHGAMSDLSPLCAQKRTSTTRTCPPFCVNFT